jgi:NADH-quinone oxidoreductase subunit C
VFFAKVHHTAALYLLSPKGERAYFAPQAMTAAELHAYLLQQLGPDAVTQLQSHLPQPALVVPAEHLLPVMTLLRNDPLLYFDLLETVSGVDYLGRSDELGVVYHLTSITRGLRAIVKVQVARSNTEIPDYKPTIPSVSQLWKTADWHEREVFDLYGIVFSGHPDLRRMFLPDDWQGHPLRKDHTADTEYHGVLINPS